MKFVALLLVLAFSAPAFSAPPTTPATAPSNTVSAMRKIELVGDPVKQFSAYVKHIASDLGMQILGEPTADGGMNLLSFTQDGNYITLAVNVQHNQIENSDENRAKPAAAEFLDGIIARVQQEMQQDFDDRRGRQLNMRADEAARIRQQQDEASRKLDEYRSTLRKETGRLDVTPANLREALSKLQDENQQLELDLRGKEARASAIAIAISELTKEAAAKTNSDDVLTELQQVVEAREKQLDLMKKNVAAGLNTPVELQQVAAQTAEARAKVAERKRDALAAAGGETLTALNRELRMLSIDRAEQEARFKLVSDQLARIARVADTIDKYEQALEVYPKLVDRAQEADTGMREIEARVSQSIRPELKVTYSRNWTEAEMSKADANARSTTQK